MIESRISGIPCLIDVHSFKKIKGSHSYNAPSDFDYYGYTEMDYTICDRNGRPAPWLERKITDTDRERIEIAIEEENENV